MPIRLPQRLRDIRTTEIVGRVRKDPRTCGDLLLGVDRQTAMNAIGWGQAEFDEPVGSLSAEDRVLLYAYWNQLGHLEELSEAFNQLFGGNSPSQPLIVVDLGCGPFTGGLALIGQLSTGELFDYIGVDRSRAMREFGEHLATAVDSMAGTPRSKRQWVADIADATWHAPPSWRPVVVIVSFLLASPSLHVGTLLAGLEQLLSRLTRGPTTILYTNSPRVAPNRTYPAFRDGLLDAGFRLTADDTGPVHTERGERVVRYALFHRDSQRTLQLGGD
ncbi:MAG: hypothetical protein OXH09_13330 [Gammaproteobacteria bacterium]|nr:hypothetical protein [Gammaproteobacteria bacterium]